MRGKTKSLLFTFILIIAIFAPFFSFAGPVSEGDPGAYTSTPSGEEAAAAATGNSCIAKQEAANAAGSVYYCLFNLTCPKESALTCWVGYTFNFAQGAILLLSVGTFVAAGIIYMLSAGDPKRIAMAKKLLLGAVSAIGVMILGRFFLTRVVGVPWL